MKMKVDIKTLGRLSQDWRSGSIWVDSIEQQLNDLIMKDIMEQIKMIPKEAHSLTCNLTNLNAVSITGGRGLSRKILKIRIQGELNVEADLIDDFKVEDEKLLEKLRIRRQWGYEYAPDIYDEFFADPTCEEL